MLAWGGEGRRVEEGPTHDVCLGADGDQTVDVFTDRDKNFASHVAALLRSGRLVFDMDTSCALLHEQLCELHNGREASVAGIGISDDGSQIVDTWGLRPVCLWSGEPLFALLAVVEELCHEEVSDFVWDGGIGIICQIGAGLVG